MSKTIKKYSKTAIVLGLILAMAAMYELIPLVQADNYLPNREMKISDSRVNQTAVTYDFEANHSTDTVKCVKLEFCDAPTSTCNAPTGMDASGGAKDSGNWSGWTAGSWTGSFAVAVVRYYNTTGEAGGDNYSMSTSGVTNSSSAPNDYYVRVTSYNPASCTDADTCCTGTVVDTGVAAFYILSSGIGVSATVAESLSASIFDTAIGFGTLTSADTYYATANEQGAITEPANDAPTYLEVTTNAASGVGITIKDEGSGSAAGLYKSSGTTKLIGAVASSDVSDGAEEYGVYGKGAGTGIIIDEGFDNDTVSDVAITRSPLPFASSSGPLNAINVDISAMASVTGITPAGDYSDTIILITTPLY